MVNSLYCQIINLIDAGIVVLAPGGRVVLWNQWMERCSGIAEASAMDQVLEDLFPEIRNSRISRGIHKALQMNSPSVLSSRLLDASFPLHRRLITGLRKSERMVQSILIKPFESDDDARFCVISIFDISSSDMRERALRTQSNMLSQLVQDLQQKDHELVSLFANTQNGILIFDRSGLVLKANPAAARIFRQLPHKLLQRPIWSLVREIGRDYFGAEHSDDDIERLLPTTDDEREMTGLLEDDNTVPLSVTANSIPFADRPRRFFVFVRDITEKKRAEAQLYHIARFDGLTGLCNRYSFLEILGREIRTHSRQHWNLSVFFIDLDRFKSVNDKLGHEAGDQLLNQVAQRLTACCRDSDTVARWSGDEFVLLLPQQNHQRSAITVAEKILATISRPFMLMGQEVYINCSIGIAQFPDDGGDAERLIFCADQAMYQAKEDGKGLFRFFTAEMNERTLQRLKIESELRTALRENQFELFYQPQVDVTTGHMVGVEALIRWNHPERGLVFPDAFISIAEECGLIAPIGAWVMTQAFETASRWYKREGNPLTMSINISPRQFIDESLVFTVSKLINSVGFPADRIVLEITEGHLMGSGHDTLAALRSLKLLGVRIAIDDFGTGYSSLAYLRHLPVDIIKIDRQFLNGAATNPIDANIVSAIIDLSHALNLEVLAEGIEHLSQMELLRLKGCDQAQGYLIGKPMALPDLLCWYQTFFKNDIGMK
ncbi:putative bifunctional diguanylate cyclase/phosphodiesterase [Parathalassolituus penaei]|uniref:cyclic-guanylate-specific phosphodiesterase n=1 Tax=Parathalassolituus penaei TaxID=2997323 RepID=A0A9X3EHL3_9GAMM|nr:EAL domain-containing protein [Parathalassolituus penaei]MCY0966865.1 EAL domain-containing protein [Parathalassolituus penaei]